MLFYTGMREGELLALTPADILPSKRIDINKNYARIKGEELFLVPKTPKAKRSISIPDFLYNDIQAYISKLYNIEKGDRIFYFTKSALDKEIKRVAEKAGLPPIRVHDLRHLKWYTKTGHGGGRFWTGYMLRFNTVYIVHKHCSPIK